MPPHKQKRPSPLDEPPTASSSSSSGSDEENPSSPPPLHHEEEEASSVDEEEASSEGEEEEASEDLPPPSVSKNPPSNPQQQSSSSESGSETDSEPEPEPVSVKLKPPPKPQPSPAPSQSASKRPGESTNNADPKRAKKKPTDSSATSSAPPSDEEAKKPGDQLKKLPRVWTEEEEVTLVKGVLDFTKKTGQDPLKPTNFAAFYDFVKKLVHGDPSLMQVKEKVRRLKKKFETLASKGYPPAFAKPHEEKLFELGRKVWGAAVDYAIGSPNGSLDKPKSNGNAVNTSKKKETANNNKSMSSANKPKPELVLAVVPDSSSSEKISEKISEKMQIDQKSQKSQKQDASSSDKMQIDQKQEEEGGHGGGDAGLFLRELARFKDGVSVGYLDEEDVKRGLELIGESKRAELSARWKKLQRAEMKLLANRLELIGEQTKLILEALRSSDH